MSYSELPSPPKRPGRAEYGLTVSGRETLKACCLSDYSSLRPNMIGQQLRCSRCSNLMTVKESKISLWQNPDAPVISGDVKALSKSVQVHMVQYSKPYWTKATVEQDLVRKGMDKTHVQDSFQQITSIQRPVSWFVKDSMQVVSPANGVTMMVGIIREGFQDRTPKPELLTQGIEDSGIEYL